MKKLNSYFLDGITLDSIDLKCMVVTKGVYLSSEVLDFFQDKARISRDPRQFSNFYFSDGISAALLDVSSWFDELTLREHWLEQNRSIFQSQALTPYSLRLIEGKAALFYKDIFVDIVSFPKKND